jgi:hypothetical protein
MPIFPYFEARATVRICQQPIASGQAVNSPSPVESDKLKGLNYPNGFSAAKLGRESVKGRETMSILSILEEPTVRWRTDRSFFVGMALAIVMVDAVGFTIAFLKTNIAEELHSTWVKVHVILFTSWILLFFAQTLLVASQKTDLHRRLGIAGIGVAAGMIVITVISGISTFLNSTPRSALEHFMLEFVVHVDMIDFAILAIAGIIFRRRDLEIHKRLMFMATVVVGIRFPMLERMLKIHIPHYIDQDLFVLAGIVYDLITRRKVNPAYIWGGLLILILPPLAEQSFKLLVPHLVAIQPVVQ